MRTPLVFSPEERGFERVTDDNSEALYATDTSRDATGEVDREEFRVRESRGDFYPQKVQLNADGQIIGKEGLGRRKQTRADAKERVESAVRDTTAARSGRAAVGEFRVSIRDTSRAQQAHLSRSQEARAADRGKRAAVTTDASRYASNPGGLDYPGVDTPKRAPNVLPKDLKQQQQPDTTAPDDPPARTNRTFDRGNVFQNTTKTEAVARGVDIAPNEGLEPRETAGVTGLSGFERDEFGGEGYTSAGGARRGNVSQGFVDSLASGAPPERALEEQDDLLSIESNEQQAADAGVLDPEPSDPFQIPDGGGLLTDGGGDR